MIDTMGDNKKLIQAINANIAWKVRELAKYQNVNGHDGNGMSPLDHAAWHGFYDVAKELLDAGALRSEQSVKIANSRGHENVAELIRQKR